jgi:hypothetical protein
MDIAPAEPDMEGAGTIYRLDDLRYFDGGPLGSHRD